MLLILYFYSLIINLNLLFGFTVHAAIIPDTVAVSKPIKIAKLLPFFVAAAAGDRAVSSWTNKRDFVERNRV